MFFAESVGNFGIRFAMLFSVAYIAAMSVLIRKTTTYRLLIRLTVLFICIVPRFKSISCHINPDNSPNRMPLSIQKRRPASVLFFGLDR